MPETDDRHDPRLLHRRRHRHRRQLRHPHRRGRCAFRRAGGKLGLGYRFVGHQAPGRCRRAGSSPRRSFYTARQFNAQEALQMNLINRLVPVAELEKYTRDYANHHRRQCAADHRRGQTQPHRIPEGSGASAISRCARRWSMTALRARTTRKARPHSWKNANRYSKDVELTAQSGAPYNRIYETCVE